MTEDGLAADVELHRRPHRAEPLVGGDDAPLLGLDQGAVGGRELGPLGGHLVQGHVDCVGALVSVVDDGFARRVRIRVPDGLERYLVEHGSVTVAGVSLTVAGLEGDAFEVSLIPETLERTTLGEAAAGERVNLEFDVVARYVERLLGLDKEKKN